jgi:hypothetical protein
MPTTAKTRSSLWFIVLLALTVYALTSVGVAIATGDKCGGMATTKTWNFAPPGWECRPVQLPGQG